MSLRFVLIATLIAFPVLVFLAMNRLPRRVVQAGTLAGLFLPLLGAFYAVWVLSTSAVGWVEIVLFFSFFFATGIGMTVGYHRLLTHRSFQTGPIVKAALLILGAMGLPSRPIDFAATHLKHHARSDREDDPHSPLDGFFHAHAGWMLDPDRPRDRERFCRRLLDDPIVVFVDRTAFLWLGLGLLIPYLIAGWNGLLWGGVLRIFVGNQIALAVNSVCHRFGSQPFVTGDESRNNLAMALLSFGEGWHNNHHAFPSAAYHGSGWAQPDLSGAVIRLLVRLGLASNVKVVSPANVERRRSQSPEASPTLTTPSVRMARRRTSRPASAVTRSGRGPT